MVYRCTDGAGEIFMLDWFKEHIRKIDWDEELKPSIAALCCHGFMSPSDSMDTYGQGQLWFIEAPGKTYATKHKLVK